jgi:hypothetical protein
MVGRYILDGGRTEITLAFEGAAVEQHLREAPVIKPDRPALHYVLFVLPTFASRRLSGAIFASDEGRMLAETGDNAFRLGHVD